MIMLNGKRIDNNIGDALPIGTLSPFVGLIAPKGYLICMGQLEDKAKYPELWELCGDTFGQSTATQFYLPDLRGQVIAGYKEGDELFGTLGGLIGTKSISYTPEGTNTGGSVGNHTLTTSEMPSHSHSISRMANSSKAEKGGCWVGDSQFHIAASRNLDATTFPSVISNDNLEIKIGNTGSGGAHNHGFTNPTFTGTQTSIDVVQPTTVMNWIIKASMIAVIQGNIEDSLTSTSSSDALSAKQGKILNDKFNEYHKQGDPLKVQAIRINVTQDGSGNAPTGLSANDYMVLGSRPYKKDTMQGLNKATCCYDYNGTYFFRVLGDYDTGYTNYDVVLYCIPITTD